MISLTKDKSFYRSFLILTVTLLAEQAVVLSVNLADNVMLGGYSETALSGVAAVNQIQFILQQLVFSVSSGIIVLGSQYWGQKKTEPIRRLMAGGFWCAAVIIVLLFAFVSLFPAAPSGSLQTMKRSLLRARHTLTSFGSAIRSLPPRPCCSADCGALKR